MTKNIPAPKSKVIKTAIIKPKQKSKEIKQVPGQQSISKFLSHCSSSLFNGDSSNATTIESGVGKESESGERHNQRLVHFPDSNLVVPSTQNKINEPLIETKKVKKRVAPVCLDRVVKSQRQERQSVTEHIFSLVNSIVLHNSQSVFVHPSNGKQHEEFIVSIRQY